MDLTQREMDEAYALAVERCQSTCRDYHATRPYMLASGVRQGPDRDQPLFNEILCELVAAESSILVAGAADAGLLAFVHGSVGDRRPSITVVDRCETPLILNQRYAERHGFSVTTCQADLITEGVLGKFDLILAHALIQFIPTWHRSKLLSRMASLLQPQGRLLIAAGLGATSDAARAVQAQRVVEGLTLRGFSLPAPSDWIVGALERQAQDAGTTFDDEAAEAEGLYAQAGIEVVARRDALRASPQTGFPRGRRYIIATLSGPRLHSTAQADVDG